MENANLKIHYQKTKDLKPSEYNPRKWDDKSIKDLTKSVQRFGLVNPILCNSAPNRRNVVIGGHFRLKIAKDLGISTVPVVYVDIPDIAKEKELNLRLNKNAGEWDLDLLAKFDESLLKDIGFTTEEMDSVFGIDDNPEVFDLAKELKKIGVEKVTVKKGDIYQLGDHRLLCGDSTDPKQIQKLMNGEKANACITDPPYILNYLKGKKKNGKATEGFGFRRDRKYLETDSLPDNFTELWIKGVSEVQHENFSIMIFENWKNIPVIWETMAQRYKVRNLIVWHCPNRTQNFAAKYKFFSKHDIALLGTNGDVALNQAPETELLQNEYESALFATTGRPHWEGYKKGNLYTPTDHIDFHTDDVKYSGQSVVFGTKPLEVLTPYVKVLTKRGDLLIEPFGGAGSMIATAEKMQRRCYTMEKVPAYCHVIMRRWEKLTGRQAKKITT